MKKAQVSIETLLVFLISLSLILIAISVVNIIDKNQQKIAYGGILVMQADQIEEFVNQACILGEGNYYTLDLARIKMFLEQKSSKELIFKIADRKIEKKFLCDIELQSNGPYLNKIYIFYQDNKVKISNSP
jgi:hypothetical protein